MDNYLSVISNFGCHYTCPYCIVKNNNMHIPETTVEGLDKLVESIQKYNCNWVSVSGGGDPLFHIDEHIDWYRILFRHVPHNVNLELHTSYIREQSMVDHCVRYIFDRIVYHCHGIADLHDVKRSHKDQIVRAVFVVDEHFTPELIDEICKVVQESDEIDELSFRQMVDSNYRETFYCYDYLKAGHKDKWWYIEQCDYNIYYAENKVTWTFESYKEKKDHG